MRKQKKKYPEGHFIGMWMIIGVIVFSGIGIPLSLVTENPGFIGVWPGMGLVIGLCIGTGIEAKMKKEGKIRPLTKEETKKRKLLVTIGVIILAVLALLGAVVFFMFTKSIG